MLNRIYFEKSKIKFKLISIFYLNKTLPIYIDTNYDFHDLKLTIDIPNLGSNVY